MASLQERPPPSTAAIAIATAIIAGLGGYFIGQGSALGLFGGTKKESWPNSYDVKVHADSSDEESVSSEDEGEQGELKGFEGSSEECKLVLVVRTDLAMTKVMPLSCWPIS